LCFCHHISYTRYRIRGIHHVEHTRVFDAVVHPQAILAILDQAGLAEKHQLLGDIRLALPQQRGQMTDTLFAIAQRAEQAQPRRMRDCAKQLGRLTMLIH
jgi:hypothetical protein